MFIRAVILSSIYWGFLGDHFENISSFLLFLSLKQFFFCRFHQSQTPSTYFHTSAFASTPSAVSIHHLKNNYIYCILFCKVNHPLAMICPSVFLLQLYGLQFHEVTDCVSLPDHGHRGTRHAFPESWDFGEGPWQSGPRQLWVLCHSGS